MFKSSLRNMTEFHFQKERREEEKEKKEGKVWGIICRMVRLKDAARYSSAELGISLED